MRSFLYLGLLGLVCAGCSSGYYAGRADRDVERILERVTKKIEGAAGDVGGITKDVKKITGDIASGKGTVGTFITDESLARNIKDSVEGAGSFIQSITGMQTIVGLRAEYNVLANSLKTCLNLAGGSRFGFPKLKSNTFSAPYFCFLIWPSSNIFLIQEDPSIEA